jgi:large subunit ribosomal protein L10
VIHCFIVNPPKESTLSLNLQDKQAVVTEIADVLKDAQTLVIAEYRGIAVSSMTQLRAKAREEGVYLRVLKNTLVRRAVQGTSFEGLADQMTGPLVYAISTDAVAAAKVLHTFAKQDAKIVLKSAVYNGKVLNAQELSSLAMIPSREELLSKLAYVMKAPVAGLARALAAVAAQKEAA